MSGFEPFGLIKTKWLMFFFFFYYPPMFEAPSIPFYFESLKTIHEPWLLNQAEEGWGMEEDYSIHFSKSFLARRRKSANVFPKQPTRWSWPLDQQGKPFWCSSLRVIVL